MPNRLADQASPYLLQHAGNPVDWYPWGEEAFERARTSERPLLLSIGYAACHWCHVMEHESFSDPGTAALMNSGFVCVKVDREERPDVDHIYMTAVQMLTGRGGWPLTVFLTPDGRPFYGGTYFPPEPRHGMPAFREVLRAVMDAWRTRRSDLVTHADELRDLIARSAHAEPGGPAPEGDPVQAAVVRLRSAFDPTHGGFGGAPKFPQPALLDLLLDWRIATGDAQAGSMVTHTLRAMARGGIRDHLAGGFHRYSVDARWLVPHFEKMLYDNAQLARTFMRAGLAEEAPDLQAVALETLDYVLADLTDAGGGFHCARDADSEGEEGRYYVWTEAEVDAVLGEDAPLFKRAYDVSAVGNWEGVNILHLPHDPDALARSAGMEPARLTATLASARARLLEVRSGRSQPLRDDKVLTDWSGLTVRALAEVGWRLGRPAYVTAAARAARFLLDTLRVDGRLLHAWRDGRRGEGSFLSDHAALGNGLLSLYEATLDPVWAREAATLADALLERFGDAGEALLHDTPADGEALIVRPRDLSDGALPSGNALAAELLARLGPLFGRDDWTERARRLVDAARPLADRHPLAFGHLLGVEARLSSGPLEVVLVGAPDAVAGLHRTLATRIIPGLVLAGPGLEESPLLAERGAPPGEARAWVCWHRTCSAPLPDAESLRDELDRVGLPRPSG